MKLVAGLLVLAACAVANAQPAPDPDAAPPVDAGAPVEPPPADPPASPEQIHAAGNGDTSSSVQGAPRPNQESGRVDPIDTGDGTWRLIGRGLLWIPRLPFEIVLFPIRGIVYLGERYHAIRTVTEIFTTDDHKFALYPSALIETGFGLNVGVRGRMKNVLGGNESLHVRGALGGQYLWTAAAGLDSGTLLGPVSASLDGIYAQRDREHFYGYGNADKAVAPAMQVDPLVDSGIESRYRIKVARAVLSVKVALPDGVSVTASSALEDKDYGADSPDLNSPGLGAVYQTDRVPGFAQGTQYSYNELEVAYDTRRQADIWDAPGIRGTGGLSLAYFGVQHPIDDGPSFFRVGVDLQRYVRLDRGPRALQFRLWGEAVTGPRDKVPFSELPRLGGENLLRGYDVDRFRDRAAIVAQAGYSWAAANWLAPVLFVDVGRVFSGINDLSFSHPRVGFGFALEAYSSRGLLLRAQIASSIDGGLFLFLSFNPAFDAQARVERY